jgi:hypothetical protein
MWYIVGMKKHIKPLHLFLIGIAFMLPFYVYDSFPTALFNVFGMVLILFAIANAVVNAVKKRKA